MQKSLSVLLMLGFIVSFFGYLLLAKKLLKVDFCFIPAFVISSISVIVYFGGIFNVLYQVSCLVYFFGYVIFIYFVLKIKKEKNFVILGKLHLLDYCFLIGSLPFLILLLKEHLLHYDNFSHWATVVKVMLSNNAFPTANDTLVGFSNYPLGTSSLLYYVALFLGHNENIFILTQGFLIFSLFYSLFGLIKKPQCFLLVSLLAVGLSTLSFFNLTIRINNLLVDFILPLITLACFTIIMRFKENPSKMLILLLPLQSLLLIVKSTGVLYLLIILVAWLIEAGGSSGVWKLKEKAQAFIVLLLSFLTYLSWQIHVKLMFSNVENKFSLSSSALGNSAAIKTSADVQTIISNYIKSSLDISSRPFLGFLFVNICVIVILILIKSFYHKRWIKLFRNIICLDIMVVLYYAGILALYVFSMPLDEALQLAGFERYASSIIVLFVGAVVLTVVNVLQEDISYDEYGHMLFSVPKDKQNYQKAILVSLSLMLLILTSEYNGIKSIDATYNDSLPYTIKNVVGDNWYNAQDNKKYLMYGNDADGQMTNYFFQYISRYYLYDSSVDAVCTLYEPNLVNLLSQYDRLVVVQSDGHERYLLKKYFNVDGKTGIYEILKDNNSVYLKNLDA